MGPGWIDASQQSLSDISLDEFMKDIGCRAGQSRPEIVIYETIFIS